VGDIDRRSLRGREQYCDKNRPVTSAKTVKNNLKLLLRYRNWREIREAQDRGEVPRRLVLRSGVEIERTENHLLLPMVTSIFFRRHYEPPGFRIGPADVVVDIGANIGAFSLYAARRTRAPIHAFEPCPETYALLLRNLASNRVANVQPEQAAVSDRTGTARFFFDRLNAGNSLFDRGVAGAPEPIEVRTITLPEVVEQRKLERIDFLKLDCEGAEGPILASTPRETLARVRRIALEFHDHVCPLPHDQLRRLLDDAGFSTRLEWNGKGPMGYLYGIR